MKRSTQNTLAATVIAGVIAGFASNVHAEEGATNKAAGGKYECQGANACKGKGACGGKGHECAGKNECKGKGWVETKDNADCDTMLKKMKTTKKKS